METTTKKNVQHTNQPQNQYHRPNKKKVTLTKSKKLSDDHDEIKAARTHQKTIQQSNRTKRIKKNNDINNNKKTETKTTINLTYGA